MSDEKHQVALVELATLARSMPLDLLERLLESARRLTRMGDLARQYEIAALWDFFGPCDRMARLAGATEADIEQRLTELPSDYNVAVRFLPAYSRGQAVINIAFEKFWPNPSTELQAAMNEIRERMEELARWGV